MVLIWKEYPKTCLLWFIYIGLICGLGILTHNHHTVTHCYLEAGQHWFKALPLYTSNARAFVYFPQSAILYYPLNFMSFPVSEVLWRCLSMGVYAWGIYRFAQFAGQHYIKFFPIMSIISIPIAFSSARNGQMNLLIAGLMMLALVATKENCYGWAASLFTLSLAFKPTALIVFLLMFVLYQPLRWRMLLGLFIAFLIPFFTANWHYVWSQYLAVAHMLQTAGNDGSPLQSWAQLFGLLAFMHITISPVMQYFCRILIAVALVVFCLWLKRRLSVTSALFYAYALGICYLLLFNPRSENNDYAFLAPIIGFMLVHSLYVSQSYCKAGILAVIAVGISEGYAFAHGLSSASSAWVTPLMCLLFVMVMLYQFCEASTSSVNYRHCEAER